MNSIVIGKEHLINILLKLPGRMRLFDVIFKDKESHKRNSLKIRYKAKVLVFISPPNIYMHRNVKFLEVNVDFLPGTSSGK